MWPGETGRAGKIIAVEAWKGPGRPTTCFGVASGIAKMVAKSPEATDVVLLFHVRECTCVAALNWESVEEKGLDGVSVHGRNIFSVSTVV